MRLKVMHGLRLVFSRRLINYDHLHSAAIIRCERAPSCFIVFFPVSVPYTEYAGSGGTACLNCDLYLFRCRRKRRRARFCVVVLSACAPNTAREYSFELFLSFL